MDVELSIVRGGGLAGVATRTELRAACAGPQEERLVAAAATALAAPAVAAVTRRPDELSYRVRLGGADATYVEAALPDAVRALVAWADGHPDRRESLA